MPPTCRMLAPPPEHLALCVSHESVPSRVATASAGFPPLAPADTLSLPPFHVLADRLGFDLIWSDPKLSYPIYHGRDDDNNARSGAWCASCFSGCRGALTP